jgi:hypothetical protein
MYSSPMSNDKHLSYLRQFTYLYYTLDRTRNAKHYNHEDKVQCKFSITTMYRTLNYIFLNQAPKMFHDEA